MTDRVQALTVILDKEYRIDDIETVVEALGMIKGVSEVIVKPVDSTEVLVATVKLRSAIYDGIVKLLFPENK